MNQSPQHDPILVVDDNRATLKLLEALFKQHQLPVVTAQSAKEAKEHLANAETRFELVLSDISMPGESGFDLLHWIKEQKGSIRDLPVILTTAQLPQAEHRVRGLEMGAIDYVVRPIELEELVLRVVHAMNNYRRIRNLQRSLEDSERQAFVGRLLAASAHEVKNLAGIVKVISDQLEVLHCRKSTGNNVPPEEGKLLGALNRASETLVDISRSARHLLHDEKPPLQTVDLGQIALETAEMMASRLRPNYVDIRALQTKRYYAVCHKTHAIQIIINMLLNAADAIAERNPEEGGKILLRVEDDESHWRLCVSDNGIGLKEAGSKWEFEAFASTKTLRGGQGLGLWLCSRFAETMEGRLHLDSDGPAKGARACLELPKGNAEEPMDLEKYLLSDEEL